MRFSKLKPHACAITRAKLGLSQQQLADLLGISKSAVGLSETRRRSLPVAAILKLAEMEIRMETAIASGTVTIKEEDSISLPAASGRLSDAQQYFIYKLQLMARRYNIVRKQLMLLDALIEKEPAGPGNMFLLGLQIHRHCIVKRLATCDLIKQTSLQNKLNLLSVKEQMKRMNDVRCQMYELVKITNSFYYRAGVHRTSNIVYVATPAGTTVSSAAQGFNITINNGKPARPVEKSKGKIKNSKKDLAIAGALQIMVVG